MLCSPHPHPPTQLCGPLGQVNSDMAQPVTSDQAAERRATRPLKQTLPLHSGAAVHSSPLPSVRAFADCQEQEVRLPMGQESRARWPPSSSPSPPHLTGKAGLAMAAADRLACTQRQPRGQAGTSCSQAPGQPGLQGHWILTVWMQHQYFLRNAPVSIFKKLPAFPASASSAMQLAALPSTFLYLVEKTKIDEN